MSDGDKVWYLPGQGDQSSGPFAADDILQRLRSGQLTATTPCWREGMDDWQPLADVEPFAGTMPEAPPFLADLPPGGRSRRGMKIALAGVGGLVVLGLVWMFVLKDLDCVSTALQRGRKTADPAAINRAKRDVAANGSIAIAIRLFYHDMVRYPETLEELYKRPEDVEKESDQWAGPYLEYPNALKDPWGQEYKYAAGAEAQHNPGKYDLWSQGANEDDDEDDIGNWRLEED